MTIILPAVTRKPVGRKYRYEADGKVVTASSGRVYTHASVYERIALTDWDVKRGRSIGDTIVFLHQRADLAAKGSSDANRIPGMRRIPGVVEIQEA